MTTPEPPDTPPQRPWIRWRAWAGYLLFAGILAWALADAPQVLWRADPFWLGVMVPFTLLNLLLQVIQTRIFLHDRGAGTCGWRIPIHFTLRKAVLNILMPVRTGTLLLLGMLTRHYPVRWIDYVGFMVIASLQALLLSLLGAVWLFLDPVWFPVAVGLALLLLAVAGRFPGVPFSGCTWPLAVNSVTMFATFSAGLWCLFRGLGHVLTLRELATLSVALNTLAQINITPGNMGVREAVMGAIAPLLSVPVASGILAGAAFFAIRLAMVGLLLVLMEAWGWTPRRENPPPEA